MSPEQIAALGALLSGLASFITALISNRKQKKKDEDVCDHRIEEIKEAFYAGLHLKEDLK